MNDSLCTISQVLGLGPFAFGQAVQHSRKPRYSISLSAVCPEKLSWDLDLKSQTKDWRSPGSNP